MINDDTPLTNEASFGWSFCEDGNKYVDDFFARNLERRINKAIALIDERLIIKDGKRLRPSESALLYEVLMHLEGGPRE